MYHTVLNKQTAFQATYIPNDKILIGKLKLIFLKLLFAFLNHLNNIIYFFQEIEKSSKGLNQFTKIIFFLNFILKKYAAFIHLIFYSIL